MDIDRASDRREKLGSGFLFKHLDGGRLALVAFWNYACIFVLQHSN